MKSKTTQAVNVASTAVKPTALSQSKLNSRPVEQEKKKKKKKRMHSPNKLLSHQDRREQVVCLANISQERLIRVKNALSQWAVYPVGP